jgi:hypothetical protein
VQNGDRLGDIWFTGANGSFYSPAALIRAQVDSPPGQTAGTFEVGTAYRILTTGTTDFTLIGAADSNPGTVFTATDVGTGTGTAILATGEVPGRLVFATTADGESSPTIRMTIKNDGKVGLGTINPGALLHVSGPGQTTSAIDTAGDTNLLVTDEGFAAGNGGSLIFGASNGTYRFASIKGLLTDGTDNSQGNIAFSTRNATADTELTERLRITVDGRVGIGTVNPGAPLDIANASPRLRLTDTDGTNTYSEIAASTGALVLGSRNNTSNGQILFRGLGSGVVSEYARFDTTGRLLVGTATAYSPVGFAHLLQIEGTASTSSSMSITRSDTTIGGTLTLAKANGGIGGNDTVTNGETLGQILFNGSNGTNRNNYSARIQSIAAGTFTTSNCPADLRFEVCASGNVAPTERMRITQEGIHHIYSSTSVLGIRSAVGSGTTNVFISARHSATGVTNGGTIAFEVKTNGNVINTNDSYGAISDIKLKENIVDAESQWDDFKAVRFRKYNFKEETGHETFTQLGVIAQELELVSPGLVTETPDLDEEGNDLGTTTKSVKYSVLTKKALVALQEAMDRIEQLEAKVAALEAQ